jgi:peptide chain release factor 2
VGPTLIKENQWSKNSLNNSDNSKREAKTCGGSFDADGKQRQLDQLQTLINDPNFWSDQDRSSKTLQQRARLEETLDLDRQVTRQLEDVQALVELAREGEPVADDLQAALKDLNSFVDKV